MRPALEPENIYAHRHEEQDVILWYNRALWHSIVSVPKIDERAIADRQLVSRRSSQNHTALELCINVTLQQVITPPDEVAFFPIHQRFLCVFP